MKRHFDTLVERLPHDAAAQFPRWGSQLCDQSARDDMEAFFRDRIGKYAGGPRILAQSLEHIGLCAEFKARQQDSLVRFLRDPDGRRAHVRAGPHDYRRRTGMS